MSFYNTNINLYYLHVKLEPFDCLLKSFFFGKLDHGLLEISPDSKPVLGLTKELKCVGSSYFFKLVFSLMALFRERLRLFQQQRL